MVRSQTSWLRWMAVFCGTGHWFSIVWTSSRRLPWGLCTDWQTWVLCELWIVLAGGGLDDHPTFQMVAQSQWFGLAQAISVFAKFDCFINGFPTRPQWLHPSRSRHYDPYRWEKAAFVRVYLPADANSLMAVMDKTLQSQTKSTWWCLPNIRVLQFYSAEEAEVLANDGLKIIDWASTDHGQEPDIVITAAEQSLI